jgi:two-component system, NarL family, response regulator NreC
MNKRHHPIKIFIAEDHATVREGIKLIINAESDLEVVGAAEDGDMAIREVGRLTPDVVLMDIGMPGVSGLKAIKQLRPRYPDMKFIALTRYDDDAYLRQALAAGAKGYVLKQGAPTHLLSAIREVAAGHSYIDPELTVKVVAGYLGPRAGQALDNSTSISEREEQVLRLVAFGYSTKEISARMDISAKTVEVYKNNASKKLGLTGRIDVIRYAISHGWMKDT